MGKYDDIINLPHHVSRKHKHMSLEDRAAQFSPFKAMVGLHEQMRETERIIELQEEKKSTKGDIK